MGFSESDSTKCRRHPNPKQLPGVCPNCLRERLSKLSTTTITATSSKTTTSSALSNSSSLSSSASTTAVSRHRRNGSEVPPYVSVGMALNTGLKKSRSVSCAPLSCKSIREKSTDAKSIINNKNCIMKNTGDDKNEKGDHQEKQGECKMKKKIGGGGGGGGGFLKKLIHTTSKKTKGALMHSKTMREKSSQKTSATTTNVHL